MNIGRRMILGFSLLIVLCSVVGIVGYMQITNLNAAMEEVADHDMRSMDDIIESKYHISEMVLLIHRYQDGETEGVKSNFTFGYNEGREHLVDLKSLHPNLGTNLDVIISNIDDINIITTDASTGIFFLMGGIS
ncbi:MAG: MCP four helix bundle domain-containing protein [Promethearchaeota archaeon]|jgi:hypothetical protein